MIEINDISKIKDVKKDLLYTKFKSRNNKSFHIKNKKYYDKNVSNNSIFNDNLEKIPFLNPDSILKLKGKRNINKYNDIINRTKKLLSDNNRNIKYKIKQYIMKIKLTNMFQ